MKSFNGFVKCLLAAVSLFFLTGQLTAQSYTDSLAQDDQDILSSIAPYPQDVRSAILGVSQYPQALVKLERVQSRSSQQFQDMIAGISRDEQEKLYEISRFPDVISKMIAGGNSMSADQVKNVVSQFPAETQTRMQQTYTAHYDLLVKMNSLYQSSQDALQKIIAPYPQDIQTDFQKVIAMPDVMNLLTENINLTVSLGEEYKADPRGIEQQLDALSTKLSQQNAEDLTNYKKQVESDPQLQTEMKGAATDFSAAYDQPDNPTYVTNNYYDNTPYPYWTSYPYWYSTPIWYPRPMYYNTGFYYGAGGRIVVVGLPSRAYSSWFFGTGYRRYPNLYHNYNSYYAIHRTNIRNVNVYRGFNNSANEHFNHSIYNRNQVGNARGRTPGGNRPPATNAPRANTNANRSIRTGQMNAPQNFNNQGIQHFHATTYHSMGWQHVGGNGGARMSAPAAPRSSGGMRSGGGGGGHATGGGGGRGRH